MRATQAFNGLKKNDKVRLHDGQTWKTKGEVVERLNETPRSYLIRTENRAILRLKS